MAPPPADELSRVGPSVLFERELPQSSCPHIEIARPDHTVTTFACFRTGKHSRIAQRPQSPEAMNRLSETNRQSSAVLPLQLQRVIVHRPYAHNADSGVIAHHSCSEYS